ncbi:MAG: hypothetical protein HY253_00795, partial [Burkholderiales bacterium]|nr:hypothetical protein [Burkholderiales bacterium]
MYPVNWQLLLEQHAQDATIVLIDGTIVHANALAIGLLNAKNLNEITGLRWNAFLQFDHPNQLRTQLQSGNNLIPTAIAEFCQLITRDKQTIEIEARLHSFQLQRQTAHVLRIRHLQTQPIAKTFQILSTQSGVPQNSLNHEALHHEKEILEMIALDNPLNQILQDVCDRMERLLDNGSVCAIMLLDQPSRCLQLAAAPSLDPEVLAQIENLKIKPGTWTCGVAVERQQICVTEDILSDAHWSNAVPSAAD